MLNTKKITIIGTGNLGTAIAKGLLKDNFPPSSITTTDRKLEQMEALASEGVNTTTDNCAAVKNADIVIMAVKPFTIESILDEITTCFKPGQIIVSVVSGVSIEKIKTRIETNNITVIRVMPNTAIAINESMTCIAAPDATEEQKELMKQLFSELGETIFINEEMVDAATVLAACGIAFAMRFIRAMVQGGIEIGFSAKVAKLIANQTVKGAAELLIQNSLHPEEEIDKVTTPKGYTISGLNEMEHNGFSSSLIKGILTSFNKIEK
jgi:pyrroline-5-carboxylate reductase